MAKRIKMSAGEKPRRYATDKQRLRRRMDALVGVLPQIPDDVVRSFALRGDEVLSPKLEEEFDTAIKAARARGRARHLAAMGAVLDPCEEGPE
jgi:hypothetical protein